jgi:hypothetical protein
VNYVEPKLRLEASRLAALRDECAGKEGRALREVERCWNELLAGKYEWSTIGKQLREKGMVRA